MTDDILPTSEVREMAERAEALDYPAWAWRPFGEKSNNFIVGVCVDGDDEYVAGRAPEDDPDAAFIETVCEKHDARGFSRAPFIAHARTDLPALAASHEALRRKAADVVEQLLREHRAFQAAVEAMNKGGVSRDEILREARERWEDHEPLRAARDLLSELEGTTDGVA